MKYTPQEVMQYIQEEDVKFIRLAFCDSLGRPKNISIMPQELERAFKYGIALDASAIASSSLYPKQTSSKFVALTFGSCSLTGTLVLLAAIICHLRNVRIRRDVCRLRSS